MSSLRDLFSSIRRHPGSGAASVDERIFEVTDDSGFLALIDPDAYEGFVDEDWTLEQLVSHFRQQMESRALLIWGTGMENIWRVALCRTSSGASGFRSVVGSIASTRGRLLLTNYESLTMAAQFADETLPQPHETDQLIMIPAGAYRLRITQVADPGSGDAPSESRVDWALELIQTAEADAVWSDIPWSPIQIE